MMEMKNVTKTYKIGKNRVYALRDLSLTVEKGEFVVVVGPSGCGKSTLLNLIGGIDTPSRGKIFVDGEDLSDMDDGALTDFRRQKVGFVFQFFNLISTLTACENVELSLSLRNIRGKRARKEALRYLEMVGISELKDRFPSELSGGEQQRVAIARALAKEPSILLADEPTGNLDTKSGERVVSTLFETAKKLGTTTVLVTHDLSITRMAERIIELRDGRIVKDRRSGTGGSAERRRR